MIEWFNPDKFRPVQNFIKGEIKNPSLITVELLAWLIDFKPRPLVRAQQELRNENEIAEAFSHLPDTNSSEPAPKPVQISSGELEKEVAVEPAESKEEDEKKKLAARRIKKVAVGILIPAVLAGGIYVGSLQKNKKGIFFEVGNKGCMYWADDHYEKVPCDTRMITHLLLPFNEGRLKNFRRITRTDTITEWSIGRIYYIKDRGEIKYYTEGGNYPDDVKRYLQVLSPYMFNVHLRKK